MSVLRLPAGLTILALTLAAVAGALGAEKRLAAPAAARRAVSFARDVQPLLARRCVACHGPDQQKAGLRLDRKADALRGGDTGRAIVPGTSAESLLVRYVTGHVPGKVMPPVGPRLTAAQVDALRAWIDDGAEWTEAAAPAAPARASHWAFQPPRPPKLPQTKRQDWARNPIDRFILARLERERLQPSPSADRPTLIRRLTLDLHGLLPTPAEVEAFVQDRSPDAYEKLVDRLLASPHFGERWARHWLDLARYADSDGYEKDLPRPYAYLYRDWVIHALNADMPFDQFTREQLAGDLLPNATLEQKIATGFHRNTLKNREGGADPEEDRSKATVDRTNTTGSVWLGLTVGCAECHTHKYDPISHREYYSLYAFFNSAQEVDLPAATAAEQEAHRQALARHAADGERLAAALATFEREQLSMRQAAWEKTAVGSEALPESIRAILRTEPDQRTPAQQAALAQHFRTVDPELARLTRALAEHPKKAPAPPPTRAQTLAESPKPPATFIHVRGDFLRKGEPVQPQTLGVLPPLSPTSGTPTRLDLARWLVDGRNPLTARVTVNRVWQQLFGRGLVATPDDFGVRGERPSHPELLDWLATGFAGVSSSGFQVSGSANPKPWSLKSLIRVIVSSATYRQSSRHRPELEARDPKNLLLARQTRFRPEAEVVRDLYLAASGLLNRSVGGPCIRPPLPADIAALGYANSVKWTESQGAERYRRGMYIFFQRTVPYPMLATFDAPDSNVTCTRRERSNTPLQALTLLNDPVFFECAQALGRRVVTEQSSTEARLVHAFRLCLARDPSATERVRLRRLYAELLQLCGADAGQAAKLAGSPLPAGVSPVEAAAWTAVARTIMNLDEFVTRE